jgi:endonuclease G, mitochondrial
VKAHSAFWGGVFGVVLLIVSCSSPPKAQEHAVLPAIHTERLELPAVVDGQAIYQRSGFSFSYDAKSHLASWVAYTLTPQLVKEKVVERATAFQPDSDVAESPKPADYRKSGYDKGHLAPAADFRWSPDAMKDCFLMTNMAPQLPAFNRRIWKNLETRVREWAETQPHSYIVTGPVLTEPCESHLKGICVPKKFFKVMLQTDGQRYRAIGFVIPQHYKNADLVPYAQSIDEVERVAGLDFFPALPDNVENQVEAEAPREAIWWN